MLELSRGEVKHVWGCLQAWADEQVTAFVASATNNEDQVQATLERHWCVSMCVCPCVGLIVTS